MSTDDGKFNSSALNFLHEFLHADGFFTDPKLFAKNKSTSDPFFKDKEEARVEGVVNGFAKKLNQGIRSTHGGIQGRASTPFSTKPLSPNLEQQIKAYRRGAIMSTGIIKPNVRL